MRITVLLAILLLGFNLKGQRACIEISNGSHLPSGIYVQLKAYKAILIGEIHGTNEAPQTAEGMVNLWLDKGKKVILGLEMPEIEQSAIDSFLLTGDFSHIKNSHFFNMKFKDGRSSIAMANLIKSCYGKKDLKVICLDITSKKTKNRDSMMAVCINHLLTKYPRMTLITLTGNIHSKLDSIPFGKTMGYYVYTLPGSILKKDEIASIDFMFENGSAWNCTPCGIRKISSYSQTIADNCGYDSFFEIDNNGDMYFFNKEVTPSLPLNSTP